MLKNKLEAEKVDTSFRFGKRSDGLETLLDLDNQAMRLDKRMDIRQLLKLDKILTQIGRPRF